jgi:type 1 fimbriae regulatory protein FimB/type 1 fimbriae regulatory protein FimE
LLRSGGEVETLMEAAKRCLIVFRHGLRASELCDLRWDQVEFGAAVLHVRRVKNGTPSTHPLRGDELRALRRLQRESESSPFVFVSERGSPFTAFFTVDETRDFGEIGCHRIARHLHACGVKPCMRVEWLFRAFGGADMHDTANVAALKH